MDQFIELMKEINIAQIVVIMFGYWFFYNRTNNKIEKLEEKLTAKIDVLDNKLSTRIDVLSNKVEDIDRRLCRIEGGLAIQWNFNTDRKIEHIQEK